jgi:DNA-binding XRE family transcriptional regulator
MTMTQAKPNTGWAKALRDKRLQLGETQKQFATRFGVTYVAVSLWETGLRGLPDRVTWWLVKNPARRDEHGNLLLPCTNDRHRP